MANMSKEVMRHEKAKGSANIRNIQKHNQATKEVVEQIRANDLKTTGSTSICIENLQYNVHIVECENFNAKIDEVLQERLAGKTIRKDAVKMLDGIYSCSPDKIKNLECCLHEPRKGDCEETREAKKKWQAEHKEWVAEYRALTHEERQAKIDEEYQWCQEYAKACVEFEKAHYGVCISAEVHFHEDTVHIHTNTIPLVKGEGGEWRLAAKDIMGNKAKLSSMQSLFHEEVGKEFGLERGTCRTGSEIKKHTSAIQKKATEMEQKLEALQGRYNELQANYTNLKEDYNELQKQYAKIVQMYSSINERMEACTKRIQASIDTVTTIVKKSIYEKVNGVEGARKRLEDVIREGKMPNIIFGQVSVYNHKVAELEEELEEDFER